MPRPEPQPDGVAFDLSQPPRNMKNVVVIVESSTAYGRNCAQGIASYAVRHGPWFVRHMPHDQMQLLDPNVPWQWRWDGVIARVASQELLDLVTRLDLPTVDVMGAKPLPAVAAVLPDHQEIIHAAAEHLLSNGLRHLAYCGVSGLSFSDAREAFFSNFDWPVGTTQHVYQTDLPPRAPLDSEGQRWLTDLSELRTWLVSLPKPVGVIACNDTRARHVIEVALAAGLQLPHDVSVIGIDNDDVICELGSPKLSSVDPNAHAIGFRAAELLDQLMDGQAVGETSCTVAPLGVERRASTNVLAFEDSVINEAIRFIRERCDESINVADVVAHAKVSRSTLERRFRDGLDCTVYDYIQHCRMERVKRLLLNTNYAVAKIAKMTGFCTGSYFGAMFKKQTGMTPVAYRRKLASE